MLYIFWYYYITTFTLFFLSSSEMCSPAASGLTCFKPRDWTCFLDWRQVSRLIIVNLFHNLCREKVKVPKSFTIIMFPMVSCHYTSAQGAQRVSLSVSSASFMPLSLQMTRNYNKGGCASSSFIFCHLPWREKMSIKIFENHKCIPSVKWVL